MRQHDTKATETSHNDKKNALKFLKENHVMVLATASNKGVPHAATVYYLVDEHFDLYFCTGEETKKFLNIKDNSNVALVVGTGPEIKTIQGGGKAEWIIEGDDAIMKRLGKNFDLQQSPFWPIVALQHKSIALMKINVEWMTFLHVFLEDGKYVEKKCKVFPK